MGKRGPAPKPTNLKLIQGTYRKDRAAPNEPRPDVSVPRCPAWLSKDAKKEWRRITPLLEEMGLVSQIDMTALAAYCQSYADLVKWEKWLSENEHIQIAPSGYASPRPEVAFRDKAKKDMKDFLVQFGLTPASRTRVSVPESKKQDESPFDKYVRKKAQ